MHDLLFVVVAHLGHDRFIAFDAVGDAVGEVQFIVVVDFSAVEIVEPVDDFGQALLFGVVGFSGADFTDRGEAVVTVGFFQV